MKAKKIYISVHKSGSLYWIDYGYKNRNILATLRPAKNMTEVYKRIAGAKMEFNSEAKR